MFLVIFQSMYLISVQCLLLEEDDCYALSAERKIPNKKNRDFQILLAICRIRQGEQPSFRCHLAASHIHLAALGMSIRYYGDEYQ